MSEVRVGGVRIGGGGPLALIAGPCVLESEESAVTIASRLREAADRHGMPLVFKASYDKANRTRLASYRGPGLERGLEILGRVRREVGVPVLADVHSPEEATRAGPALDCLQVPAFLARQTDLLVAAGRSGRPVNVKKAPFMAPEDMAFAAEKVEAGGAGGVLLTERGTTFGYHGLVVDFQGMARLASLGYPVVFDATHSVQRPSAGCGQSAGDRRCAAVLARAAVAAGVDGVFLEVHPDPDRALCDGPNSLALDDVDRLLRQLAAIDRVRRETS